MNNQNICHYEKIVEIEDGKYDCDNFTLCGSEDIYCATTNMVFMVNCPKCLKILTDMGVFKK